MRLLLINPNISERVSDLIRLEAQRTSAPGTAIEMLTEAALASAHLLGNRISVIAISQRIQAWHREVITAYGFEPRLVSIRGLPPAVEALLAAAALRRGV